MCKQLFTRVICLLGGHGSHCLFLLHSCVTVTNMSRVESRGLSREVKKLEKDERALERKVTCEQFVTPCEMICSSDIDSAITWEGTTPNVKMLKAYFS
jgi:hypothetical protein